MRRCPSPLLDRVATRSDGVPLFAEELVKGVIESGHDLTGPLSGLTIPETLQDSLMARLDRLGDAKEVAQLSAAARPGVPLRAARGRGAHEGGSRYAKGSGGWWRRSCSTSAGLPPKATYTFRHALVQDTAYQSMLESQRQELHGRIADALEKHFPERAARRARGGSAHHCEEAGRTAQGDWLLPAGRGARGAVLCSRRSHRPPTPERHRAAARELPETHRAQSNGSSKLLLELGAPSMMAAKGFTRIPRSSGSTSERERSLRRSARQPIWAFKPSSVSLTFFGPREDRLRTSTCVLAERGAGSLRSRPVKHPTVSRSPAHTMLLGTALVRT